ncbi:phosphatidylglycerol lysyltransferase domain-containing protein [Cetobacterium sp.]|uniref:phosphatidylglycerol lysyltransferase domain-containing protein n=2 Tax=Cetobacterium sp. TaxID=2071632 RepID=UPI002FC7C24B
MNRFKFILKRIFPDILSILIFLSGTLIIFSNTTKFTMRHIKYIYMILPGDVIVLSHFSSNVIGTFLLILAYGIYRRLDSAYYLSVVSFVLAIFFSFFKGFNYIEAFIFSIILLLLIPSKDRFYRKSSILKDKLSPTWILLTLSVILLSIFFGLYSFKTVEYKKEVLWHLALNRQYTLFLRNSFVSISIFCIFLAFNFFNTVLSVEKIPSSKVLEDVKKIINLSDNSYSGLAYLSDKSIIFNKLKTSFIMFGNTNSNLISMGDPIGDKKSFQEIIREFYRIGRESGKNIAFYEISKEHLAEYLELGLKIIKIGEEAIVNLDSYDISTPTYKKIRYTFNKFEKLNYTFKVVDSIEGFEDELKLVSDNWLDNKKAKEKTFSLGRFDLNYLKNFKLALLFDENNKLIAFSNLMSTHDKNEMAIDLMRYLDSAPSGTMEYLFIKIINWSKENEYKRFSLGMAPLSGIYGGELAPLWNRLSVFLFNHGGNFYNFEGLRQFKDKFAPEWESKYLAYSGHFNLASLLKDIAFLISGGLLGIFSKK